MTNQAWFKWDQYRREWTSGWTSADTCVWYTQVENCLKCKRFIVWTSYSSNPKPQLSQILPKLLTTIVGGCSVQCLMQIHIQVFYWDWVTVSNPTSGSVYGFEMIWNDNEGYYHRCHCCYSAILSFGQGMGEKYQICKFVSRLSFLSFNQVKLSLLSFGSRAAVAPALSSAVARSFHR